MISSKAAIKYLEEDIMKIEQQIESLEAAGDIVTLAVRRQGGTGSDTMTTNPARLVGVRFISRSSR
jgi:hypothetical protein